MLAESCDTEDPDFIALEGALYQCSGGTMTAELHAVVKRAREKWGYPGTLGTAVGCLISSERYEIVRDELGRAIVRPKGERPRQSPGLEAILPPIGLGGPSLVTAH